MKVLCGLFGKTRHAWYDRQWREQQDIFTDEIILQAVQKTRQQLPRVGTRKLQELIAPELASHGIEVGRDYLFDLLAQHKLLIRQRKRKAYTTDSRHWMRKYSNLTGQLVIHRPEQLWVSDMTYIRIQNQWGYLSLITDAWSRKIMGFCLRSDMLAEGCVTALQMALDNRSYEEQPLIHHSDRGAQYCCKQYVDVLTAAGIAISMTENGDPYENALAERINGIIKGEFNLYTSQLNFEQTCQKVQESITAYNEIRPHGSCDNLTPNQAHQTLTPMKKRWRSYPRLETAPAAGPLPSQSKGRPLVYGQDKIQYLSPERQLSP
ncbi:MAG TPA: IS3 family transposase [Puia sp.]|nr:IS3 family transposase [Puia sp.]